MHSHRARDDESENSTYARKSDAMLPSLEKDAVNPTPATLCCVGYTSDANIQMAYVMAKISFWE